MTFLRHLAAFAVASLPTTVFAQPFQSCGAGVANPCPAGFTCVQGFCNPIRHITVATGVRMPLLTALQKALTFLVVSIEFIAAVLFLVGALYLVTAGGNAERAGKAKKLMAGSLIGMGIVLGSYTILRTVVYFLYGGS